MMPFKTVYMQDLLYPGDQPVPLRFDAADNVDLMALIYFKAGFVPLSKGLTPEEYEQVQAVWIGFELTEERLPHVVRHLAAGETRTQ